MSLTLADHALVAFLAFVLPLYGWWDYRRFVRRVALGAPGARVRFYGQQMLFEWVLALAVVLVWIGAARPAHTLGLHGGGGLRFWIGIALVAAGSLALALQVLAVRRPGTTRNAVRRQLEPHAALLPHDRRELRAFLNVSVAAGISEELVYRGFLMAYFGALAGLPAAVLFSSAVFALGHAYQGPAGAARTFVVGLVMAGLYVLTGSLWAPMIAHVALDVASGLMARFVLGGANSTTSPA